MDQISSSRTLLVEKARAGNDDGKKDNDPVGSSVRPVQGGAKLAFFAGKNERDGE